MYLVYYVTISAATVSLFGSSFMLATILLFGKSKGLSKLIVFLAIGDWGWSLSVVVTHIILLSNRSVYDFDVCIFFRLLFQFFGGSTVFWTTCISIYLYKCVFYATPNPSNNNSSTNIRLTQDKLLMVIFHVLSWGIPLIFCIILIFTHQMEQDKATKLCFPLPGPHFYMWFLPIVICFIVSVIVYIRLMIRLKQTMSWTFILKGFRDQTLSLPFRISLYLIVFFLCWSLDITQYVIITFDYGGDRDLSPQMFILVLIYNILLMSQGTLDVLVRFCNHDEP